MYEYKYEMFALRSALCTLQHSAGAAATTGKGTFAGPPGQDQGASA